ncbi:hypothetical protein [Streptomyces cyaneofuscatus]|uniref:hypothetical protein n=1 Tax=Streptomyces cyaneofuscatus TaxID=66883 RepID=UPI00365DEFB0
MAAKPRAQRPANPMTAHSAAMPRVRSAPVGARSDAVGLGAAGVREGQGGKLIGAEVGVAVGEAAVDVVSGDDGGWVAASVVCVPLGNRGVRVPVGLPVVREGVGEEPVSVGAGDVPVVVGVGVGAGGVGAEEVGAVLMQVAPGDGPVTLAVAWWAGTVDRRTTVTPTTAVASCGMDGPL